MLKLYVRKHTIETSDGETLDVTPQTLAAAKQGHVTDTLRRAAKAALGEEVLLEQRN